VVWSRIGFNKESDPDPAFYLCAVPDPDPRSQIKTDPDLAQTLMSQKVIFT
jgi:hypothetical protein